MDIAVLEELSKNVQLPIDQLASVYLAELQGLRQTLADSLAGEDSETAHRTAHSIKGAALSIGADELATLARRFETEPLEAIDLIALDQTLRVTEQAIEAHLTQQTTCS